MMDLKGQTRVPSGQHVPWQLRQDTASIESDLQQAFGSGSRQLVGERGREIISAGVTCQHFFQLKSGLACRQRPLLDGRQAILDVYRPGDFIGLENLFFAPALDTVLALTNVSYRAIELAALNRLIQDPRIALHLIWHIAEEKKRVDTVTLLLGQLNAHQRTAALLLFLWRRLRLASGRGATGTNETGLPFTQRQLASFLGLDVIHLNRVLSQLRDSGALKLRKGAIIVEDVTRLTQIAGVAYRLACEAQPRSPCPHIRYLGFEAKRSIFYL
jgi:CRP-like cAMP-binding protein